MGSSASVFPPEAKRYLDSITPGPSGRKAGAWDCPHPRQPTEQLGGSHPVLEWRGLFKTNLIDGGPRSAKGKRPPHRSTHLPGFCGMTQSGEPRRGGKEGKWRQLGGRDRAMKEHPRNFRGRALAPWDRLLVGQKHEKPLSSEMPAPHPQNSAPLGSVAKGNAYPPEAHRVDESA